MSSTQVSSTGDGDRDSNRGRRAEVEAAVARGRALLDEGRTQDALECFADLHAHDPANAVARSYYGLALAIADRRFDQGVELGRSALKQEFFNPDLYLNMARIHLTFGFKAEALRYLRRGRMIDPGSRAIRALLQELGSRQRQTLRFLPRGHILNRWLGRVRARWIAGSDTLHAA
jgi:tetratricopeptide (TPR) repeat protein